MPDSLQGKVILITGSTQGLGEEIARLSAERGAAGIVLTGRSAERGEALAAGLGSAQCRVIFVQAELASTAACQEIVKRTDQEFGRVDCLVNAAACTERGTLEDTSAEHWDKIMAINLRAPFLLIQGAVRIMQREGNGGSIVNIQSMSAHGGTPNLTAYSVSKGGLGVLTRNAAHSQRAHKIRVNALNIGWMATPAEHAVQRLEGQPEDWLLAADKGAPFGRILRPRDVAGMAAYLLSDEACMMTGALVDFDQHVMGIYDP
ncbi:MAG: SDR family oxidoreductase [Acidobacteriia bacterium]|nr:SDR family oxidoreductase [Terriglobia bacterium]MYG04706.1 SDR family oxidoreductase [Terriglobia bacterium]MYK10679.1 SDR family oxidoreductase [Terriglobia bacterium]